MATNYKPIKWLKTFDDRYNIKTDDYVKKYDEFFVLDNNNHIYSSVSYIFKVLSNQGLDPKKLISYFEKINNETTEHYKSKNTFKEEIEFNNNSYFYVMHKNKELGIEREEFLLKVHLNRLLFTILVDYIICLINYGKDVAKFYELLDNLFENKMHWSNWSKQENSDINSIYSYLSDDDLDYDQKTYKIMLDYNFRNQDHSYLTYFMVLKNFVKLHSCMNYDSKLLIEYFELIDSVFDNKKLENETNYLNLKYETLIRDYDFLKEVHRLTILEDYTKHYVIIPYMTIKNDKLPNVFILMFINSEFTIGEHTIVLEDGNTIKYTINKYVEEELDMNSLLVYESETSNIYLENHLGNDKKERIEYLNKFLEEYLIEIKEQLDICEIEDLKNHYLRFLIDKEFKTSDDIIIETNKSIDEMVKDYISEREYKPLLRNNFIINSKYNEYELLFWYIPLVTSHFMLNKYEIKDLEEFLKEQFKVLSNSLSLLNEKNEKIYYTQIEKIIRLGLEKAIKIVFN